LYYLNKILVVEDVALIALDIKTMLLSIGFNDVRMVYKGKDAIKCTETSRPDLILMDIILGNGLNGIQTVQEILKKEIVPVIYITGSTDIKTLKEASETSLVEIIHKPVHLPDFEIAVKTTLGIECSPRINTRSF